MRDAVRALMQSSTQPVPIQNEAEEFRAQIANLNRKLDELFTRTALVRSVQE
jgi:hypothetical protein